MNKFLTKGMKTMALLAAVFIASIFVSCYSYSIYVNPKGGFNICAKGYVTNEQQQGIDGIKVTSVWGTTTTNETGYYEILICLESGEETSVLKFEDIDGSKNLGKFKTEEVTIKYETGTFKYGVEQNVVLVLE